MRCSGPRPRLCNASPTCNDSRRGATIGHFFPGSKSATHDLRAPTRRSDSNWPDADVLGHDIAAPSRNPGYEHRVIDGLDAAVLHPLGRRVVLEDVIFHRVRPILGALAI